MGLYMMDMSKLTVTYHHVCLQRKFGLGSCSLLTLSDHNGKIQRIYSLFSPSSAATLFNAPLRSSQAAVHFTSPPLPFLLAGSPTPSASCSLLSARAALCPLLTVHPLL